ncbi:MAG TPA: MraY family glycosyltransferase, partial [Blastocatellia bacterium]|nr:MraY family glycosyltransferase [Blastocatellia bacterium]
MQVLWGGLFTLLAAVGLTVAVRKAALVFGVVSHPRQDRWHRKPTAMLGGIAIYLGFMAGYLLFAPKVSAFYPILASATLLFATGLIDDVVQIKPYTKLIVQLIAAAIVVYSGARLPWTHNEAVNDFLTIFWLVGITNALNLLDNMDGLAAGITFISCVFLGITFAINGQGTSATVAAIMAGSVLGFLFFNFHPATIFMGDSGSMFLGFALGGTALLSDYGRSRNLTAVLFTPALILAIPIFDTCVVTLTRKLSGRPISQGGRDHTSHRLVALGMSEKRAVLWLYAAATISGGLALLVRLINAEVGLLLVPGFALVVVFVGLYLGKVRISEATDQRPESTIINVLTDFTYKRRVLEVLLDLVLVVFAYWGAYLLRWDGSVPREQVGIFIRTLPLLIVVQMSFLLLGGVYRGLWRYIGA